jgi:hypothetical protein
MPPHLITTYQQSWICRCERGGRVAAKPSSLRFSAHGWGSARTGVSPGRRSAPGGVQPRLTHQTHECLRREPLGAQRRLDSELLQLVRRQSRYRVF